MLALVLSLWSRAREVSIQYLYLVTCHLPEWDGTKNSEKIRLHLLKFFQGLKNKKKWPAYSVCQKFHFLV